MGCGIACPVSLLQLPQVPSHERQGSGDHRTQNSLAPHIQCRAIAVLAQEDFWGGIKGAATERVQLMDSKLVTLAKVCNCYIWGTIPSMGNVAQPPLGKASVERGWRAGPTSVDKFSRGKSGLHCT